MTALSVVIPVYQAERTIEHCLQCLRDQSFKDYEVVVVESGGAACREIISQVLPAAHYLSFNQQLLAHAASNRGVEKSAGSTLVFLDPDAYPAPDWLARIQGAINGGAKVVAGGVGCYGSGWLAGSAHFVKFDKWLAGLPPGSRTEAPTVNFAVRRELFNRYGPFREDTNHADVALCWRLAAVGVEISFVPQAVVEHHHIHTASSLLAERFQRGRTFGRLENELKAKSGLSRRVWRIMISLLPLRLLSQLVRVGRHARQANQTNQFIIALPLVAAALYAWLVGEVTSLSLNERLAD